MVRKSGQNLTSPTIASKTSRRQRIAGSGGYKEVIAAMKPMVARGLRDSGDYLGRAVAAQLALPQDRMGAIGRGLGARFSRLIGSGPYGLDIGDYAVRGDVANDRIFGRVNAFATLESKGMDCAVITAREYIGDIYSGPQYVNQGTPTTYSLPYFNNFDINPGIARTFQRLSQLAQNYESYALSGCVFEYISSASPYVTGSSLGTIGMTWRRNAYAPDFTDKQSFTNTEGALNFRLDGNGLYGVECAKDLTEQDIKYIRTGPVDPDGLTKGETDHGKFTLAVYPSANVPYDTILGELWVTYKVCLMGPKASDLVGGYAEATNSTSVGGAAPFGTGTTTYIKKSLELSTTGTTIVLPYDRIGLTYRVTATWVGGSGACTLPTISYTGLTAGSSTVSPQPGATATSLEWDQYVTVSKGYPTAPTITFATGGTYPTGATATVRVQAVGYYAISNL